MDSDYEMYVAKRCQRALEENDEYMGKELGATVSQDELQSLAEKLCYEKGCNDTMARLLKCSHDL